MVSVVAASSSCTFRRAYRQSKGGRETNESGCLRDARYDAEGLFNKEKGVAFNAAMHPFSRVKASLSSSDAHVTATLSELPLAIHATDISLPNTGPVINDPAARSYHEVILHIHQSSSAFYPNTSIVPCRLGPQAQEGCPTDFLQATTDK